MHIEKNICDNIVGTIMNIKEKTKDTIKKGLDSEKSGFEVRFALVEIRGQVKDASYSIHFISS